MYDPSIIPLLPDPLLEPYIAPSIVSGSSWTTGSGINEISVYPYHAMHSYKRNNDSDDDSDDSNALLFKLRNYYYYYFYYYYYY